jgi:hypothetical protein
MNSPPSFDNWFTLRVSILAYRGILTAPFSSFALP